MVYSVWAGFAAYHTICGSPSHNKHSLYYFGQFSRQMSTKLSHYVKNKRLQTITYT